MNKVRFDNRQIPLHYQIADYLLDMLKRGEMKPLENLPPEEEMREIFGVSRTTIRRALDHLHGKGFIIRKQGKGTFWTEEARGVRQEKLVGINRQIFNIEDVTTVRVLSNTVQNAGPDITEFLGLTPDEKVSVFRRLRFSKQEPMSYTVNYLPRHIGGMIEKQHLRDMTMLETLESVCNIRLGTIRHEVEVTRASSEIAECLQIAVLDPVLTVNTSVYDKDGGPVEIVWTYFVENKYKFRVVFDE